MKTQWIAIDWDHSIYEHTTNTLLPGVHEAFDKIKDAGFNILIYSCNSPTFIRDKCNEFDLHPDKIYGEEDDTEVKPLFAALIDDRAFHFDGDWGCVDGVIDFVKKRPIK